MLVKVALCDVPLWQVLKYIGHTDGGFVEGAKVGSWPAADPRHPAPSDRSRFKAAGRARIVPLKIERQLPCCRGLR